MKIAIPSLITPSSLQPPGYTVITNSLCMKCKHEWMNHNPLLQHPPTQTCAVYTFPSACLIRWAAEEKRGDHMTYLTQAQTAHEQSFSLLILIVQLSSASSSTSTNTTMETQSLRTSLTSAAQPSSRSSVSLPLRKQRKLQTHKINHLVFGFRQKKTSVLF